MNSTRYSPTSRRRATTTRGTCCSCATTDEDPVARGLFVGAAISSGPIEWRDALGEQFVLQLPGRVFVIGFDPRDLALGEPCIDPSQLLLGQNEPVRLD